MCRKMMYLVSLVLALGAGLTAGVAGASEIKINFQSAGAPIPDGYLPEYGDPFFEHDDGWSYGWDQNIRSGARDRNNANAPDQRYDTLNHLQQAGGDKIWEIELPNGTYNLLLVCGDPSYTDQTNNFDVEGIILEDPDGPVGTGFDFDEFNVTVELTDGRLTIQPATGAGNCKICFVDIESEALTQFFQKARDPDPADGAEGISTPILIWTPGDTAVSHRVNFGPDPEALVQVAEQDFTVYWHPEPVDPGTRYYWRIDGVEADGTVIPGDLWSFVTLSMSAWGPSPSDGARDVMINTQLSWKPGDSPYPLTHHVFFGTDEAAVAAGTGDTDKGAQEGLTYDPGVLAGETTYYFRVNEIDVFGDEREGSVWSFKTVPPGPGKIVREWWFDISGSNVTNLTSDARYPNSPDGSEFVSYFQGPANWAEQYGSRLRGWLFAPETGNYTFLIEAQDEGEIRLSTDEDPANAVMIASTAGTPESQPQGLVAGERYYIEALMKENTIGDSIMVSWSGPGIGTMTVISADYVGATPYLAEKAYSPFPPDGASGVKQTAMIDWKPGVYAASHQLYFGTDEDLVTNADAASPEFKGDKQLGDESFDPGKLAWDTTYFWRVDEINTANPDGPWTGNVWSFSTGAFLVVDDFESYDDVDPAPGEPGINRIFDKWIDGFGTTTNGALAGNDMPPYAEQTIVHGGAQSLIYRYDNNLKTSEATLTLVYPRDWTEEGVTKLSLWFIGDPANAAERMFVALNGTAVAYHDDPAATQVALWTEWVIDLTSFAGVDLANVNTITIGLGTKNAPAAGGAG
ncbi:MAG: PA14 domain-containing protein, partial [Planctomycetota bacterium]|nr:PA14 domain-containing protein [Planctomycetota bacterium]